MTDTIDGDMPEPVLTTVSELARRCGVTRQSMHERVRRLAERHAGLMVKKGRSLLVDVALFETAVAADGDPVREAGQDTRRTLDGDDDEPVSTGANHYRDAQTERARIDARIKALELAKLQGQLVPVDGPNGIMSAMRAVAEKVSGRVEMMPRVVQRLVDEGLVTDQAAARRILKAEVDDMMRKIAGDLRKLSMDASTRPVSVDIEGEEIRQ